MNGVVFQVEYLVADVVGPACVASFLHDLHSLCTSHQPDALSVACNGSGAVGEQSFALQNYVLWWLAEQLGAVHVSMFVNEFLPPARFSS